MYLQGSCILYHFLVGYTRSSLKCFFKIFSVSTKITVFALQIRVLRLCVVQPNVSLMASLWKCSSLNTSGYLGHCTSNFSLMGKQTTMSSDEKRRLSLLFLCQPSPSLLPAFSRHLLFPAGPTAAAM